MKDGFLLTACRSGDDDEMAHEWAATAQDATAACYRLMSDWDYVHIDNLGRLAEQTPERGNMSVVSCVIMQGSCGRK